MKVGKLFPSLRDVDLHVALAGPFRERLKAAIAFACSKEQIRIMRYVFPNERVRWEEEVRTGRIMAWVKKM